MTTTTTQSSVLTAKRASTEEEAAFSPVKKARLGEEDDAIMESESSDVSAKGASTEEEFSSSPVKKARVEEEGDASLESESSDASMESDSSDADPEADAAFEAEAKAKAEAEGRVRIGGISYFPEPEPEWDVDSYDGREYVSDPETRKLFATDADYLEYRKEKIEALENRGFLPDIFNYITPLRDLEEDWVDKPTKEYLADLACLCVKKLNEEKGKTVEFVRIERANISIGGRWKLYITFMAREYQNGPLVEYQAKAMDSAGGARPPFPILCRPAPKLS